MDRNRKILQQEYKDIYLGYILRFYSTKVKEYIIPLGLYSLFDMVGMGFNLAPVNIKSFIQIKDAYY